MVIKLWQNPARNISQPKQLVMLNRNVWTKLGNSYFAQNTNKIVHNCKYWIFEGIRAKKGLLCISKEALRPFSLSPLNLYIWVYCSKLFFFSFILLCRICEAFNDEHEIDMLDWLKLIGQYSQDFRECLPACNLSCSEIFM